MIRNPTGLFRAIALPLALALAVPATAYAQDPMARAKELYDEGSTLYSAADYNGAIEKFTAALKIVTAEGTDAHVAIRGDMLLNIAKAHVNAYDVDADIGHLRAARSIYKRFADEAERGAGYAQTDVDEATSQIDDLQRRIEEWEEKDRPPEPNNNGPQPPTIITKDSNEADVVRHRSIGIGLIVGGSVLTLAGIGAAIWGTTFERFAIESVIDEGGDPNRTFDDFTGEEKAYVDQQASFGTVWVGVGIGVAVVGAAGIGVGAWQIAKSNKLKQEGASASLTPVFTRDFAGLSLRGRF